MLEKLLNIFRVPDLRKRILFTLAMLAVYRLDTLSVWIDFFLNTGIDEFGESPRSQQIVRDFPAGQREPLRSRLRTCSDPAWRVALPFDVRYTNPAGHSGQGLAAPMG